MGIPSSNQLAWHSSTLSVVDRTVSSLEALSISPRSSDPKTGDDEQGSLQNRHLLVIPTKLGSIYSGEHILLSRHLTRLGCFGRLTASFQPWPSCMYLP